MTINDGLVYNGMPAADLGETGWERPWSGTSGGQCVEMKRLADGRVAVRQSTDPAGPALIYTPEEMGAFVTGVKNGLADHMTEHQPAGTRPADRGAHPQAAQTVRANRSIS
ncbi:DUF397 domain-containing protein [Streptomyces sp. NBC_01476]|nr:DUF397 domain-containing protein [Streptomyces sp. NBC_01476]